jgi:hypothetical protein
MFLLPYFPRRAAFRDPVIDLSPGGVLLWIDITNEKHREKAKIHPIKSTFTIVHNLI